MAAKIELSKARNGKFRFALKSANGRIVVTSELYEKRVGATNGIRSLRAKCDKDDAFNRKKARNGKPYFVMMAKNGKTIARSQQYASTATMEKGIRAVKNTAKDAEVNDLTK